jgi:hypothetical protein
VTVMIRISTNLEQFENANSNFPVCYRYTDLSLIH